MEQPNLNYINQLCGDDNAFKNKLIAIIKKELPIEIASYQKSMEDLNYKNAAEHVHKLKHKISLLGLEKSYYFSEEYENNLLCGTDKSKNEFETILQSMHDFVNKL